MVVLSDFQVPSDCLRLPWGLLHGFSWYSSVRQWHVTPDDPAHGVYEKHDDSVDSPSNVQNAARPHDCRTHAINI
eukprot:1112209-Prymnesium_polylepis.1